MRRYCKYLEVNRKCNISRPRNVLQRVYRIFIQLNKEADIEIGESCGAFIPPPVVLRGVEEMRYGRRKTLPEPMRRPRLFWIGGARFPERNPEKDTRYIMSNASSWLGGMLRQKFYRSESWIF